MFTSLATSLTLAQWVGSGSMAAGSLVWIMLAVVVVGALLWVLAWNRRNSHLKGAWRPAHRRRARQKEVTLK
jgi:hypothetical protein